MFDDILDVFSLISAVISIVCAIIAAVKAVKAKGVLSEIEGLKAQIVSRRRMIGGVQVHAETTRVLGVVAKIGPSSSPRKLTGIRFSDIAEEMDTYIRYLSENCFGCGYDQNFEGAARKLILGLRGLTESLSEVRDKSEAKKLGSDAYRMLQEFVPLTKQLENQAATDFDNY